MIGTEAWLGTGFCPRAKKYRHVQWTHMKNTSLAKTTVPGYAEWLNNTYRVNVCGADIAVRPWGLRDVTREEVLMLVIIECLRCVQCGYQWYPRKPEPPKRCPHCRRATWDRSKERPVP